MADEEKPVADEQTTEAAEAAKSDTDETIEASDDSAAENSSGGSDRSNCKNVQERASEMKMCLPMSVHRPLCRRRPARPQ